MCRVGEWGGAGRAGRGGAGRGVAGRAGRGEAGARGCAAAGNHWTIPSSTHPSTFRASEARVLRVMISSFYDMLGVTLRSLRDFA